MKKILIVVFSVLFGLSAFAQTASNFNCNDCASTNHDLFTELNAGKVVVICWVMPCSNCISGALAAQSACNSFSGSNPGQVLFYVADDVANTSCTTLSSWCNTNGISPNAKFSNAAVSMSAYGASGMPKVVVLGDANHTVYYNQNGGNISTSGVQTAISNALAAIATGVNEIPNSTFGSTSVFPNPSNTSCTISFNLLRDSKIKMDIVDVTGKKVSTISEGSFQKGENSVKFNTADLGNGNYFINFSDGVNAKKVKLIVVH